MNLKNTVLSERRQISHIAYIKHPEWRQNGFPGVRRKGEGKQLLSRYKFLSRVMNMFWGLDRGGGCNIINVLSATKLPTHFKMVNFMLYAFYLNFLKVSWKILLSLVLLNFSKVL